jgi:hypothetical protein
MNLTFYQRFSSDFISPTNHHLGVLVIFAPVIGGLIIGLTARYGSEKIRGRRLAPGTFAIEPLSWKEFLSTDYTDQSNKICVICG